MTVGLLSNPQRGKPFYRVCNSGAGCPGIPPDNGYPFWSPFKTCLGCSVSTVFPGHHTGNIHSVCLSNRLYSHMQIAQTCIRRYIHCTQTSMTAYVSCVPYLLKTCLYSYKAVTIQIQCIGPLGIYQLHQIGIQLFNNMKRYQGSSDIDSHTNESLTGT